MKLESFDNSKKKCYYCKSYFTPNNENLFCSDHCYSQYKISDARENIAKKYKLKAGELQWLWRCGKRKDKSELSDAIIDALAEGGIYSWNGDGVSCVVQIIEAFAKQQNEN